MTSEKTKIHLVDCDRCYNVNDHGIGWRLPSDAKKVRCKTHNGHLITEYEIKTYNVTPKGARSQYCRSHDGQEFYLAEVNLQKVVEYKGFNGKTYIALLSDIVEKEYYRFNTVIRGEERTLFVPVDSVRPAKIRTCEM